MTFQIGIGTSQNWDEEKAVTEVIQQANSRLSSPPSFILLFSTIHYEKNNGFQKMLNKIYETFSEETPLIGSTVAGFMNSTGVFSRGLTLLLVYSNELLVKIGYGKNVKRNPNAAAMKCIEKIKDDKNSYKNKMVISIVSGPTRPNFPFLGRKFVINSGVISFFATKLMDLSTYYLQKGFGREEEFLEKLSQLLPDYTIIGGSSSDDNRVINNYQFYNKQVLTNSAVILALYTNIKISPLSYIGYKPTGKKLKITKKFSKGRIISEIENKPASQVFIEAVKLTNADINEHLHRKTFFTPLGYYNNDNYLCPLAIGGFLSNSFYFSYGTKKDELEILTGSGTSVLKITKDKLQSIQPIETFLFGIFCSGWLETLGKNNYDLWKLITKNLGETPFLILYMLGEEFREPNKEPIHLNLSFNIISFSGTN